MDFSHVFVKNKMTVQEEELAEDEERFLVGRVSETQSADKTLYEVNIEWYRRVPSSLDLYVALPSHDEASYT